MNWKAILFILFIFLSSAVFSQDYKKKADAAFNINEYSTAITLYKSAFSRIENNIQTKAQIAYRIGYCNRKISKPLDAQLWFSKAIELKINEPDVYLYLADAQRMNQNFDEAIKNYNEYKLLVPQDIQSEKGIESCKLAKTWIKNPTEYIVTNLSYINSAFIDYCPYFVKEGNTNKLYFSSTRPSSVGDQTHGGSGQSFSDIFVSSQDAKKSWSFPEPLPQIVNTIHEEGSPSLTKDNKIMVYTYCRYDKDNSSNCKIYQSINSGGKWQRGILQDFSDSKKEDYDYAHPTISKDGLTIYFSTNKPGYGGYDIWYSTRETTSSPWKKAKNAGGVINTSGDEVFPYLRNDSILYFSSNGHLGMGGLDIYRVNRDVKGRDYVLNLLSPMNSTYDDYGITYKGKREEGFFTSNRPGSKGFDDIYHFTLPTRTFSLAGTIRNEMTDEPIPFANVRLIGSDGTSLEVYADKNGEYSFDLNPQTNYVIISIHDSFLNAKYKISTYGLQKDKDFSVNLYMTQIDMPIEVSNIMYDVNRWELRPESIVALEKLLEILRDNPHIVIELSSHTDHRQGRISNDELSQRRAQSVVNFLIAKGIDSKRLYAKGYGATKPKRIDIKYSELYSFFKLGDILTPEYISRLQPAQQQVAYQINRRTEFRVIGTDFH